MNTCKTTLCNGKWTHCLITDRRIDGFLHVGAVCEPPSNLDPTRQIEQSSRQASPQTRQSNQRIRAVREPPLQRDPTPDRLNNRHIRLRPPTLSIDRHVKPTLCQIPSQPNQSIQFVGAVREPPVLWPVSSANLPADFGEDIQRQHSVMKALNAPSFMMRLKIASLPFMRSNGSVSKCRQKPKSKTVSLL